MRARHLISGVAVLLTAAACAESAPGLPPPGLDGKAPALFYPEGLALSKDATTLYVANSNIDRAYSDGTLVGLPVTLFDEAARTSSHTLAALPKTTPVGRIDGFAGRLALNPAGDALYLTSRDHNLLTRIPLDAQGGFRCDDSKATGCSAEGLQLGAQDMPDPFALTFADLVPPGGTTPEPFVVVSHLSTVSTGTGTTAKDAFVAFIPEALAHSQGQLPFSHGAYKVDVGTVGSDSLVFDEARRRLLVGGCYIRVDPQTVISCQADPDTSLNRTNPLRTLSPEAGTGAPVTQLALGPVAGGGNVAAMALSSDGTRLYLALSRPSALATVAVPEPGAASAPELLSLVPLASQPSRMLVLRRAAGDLAVVTETTHNSLSIVDPNAGLVLAQLDPDRGMGKGPYELASAPATDGDRVYVGLFNGCAVQALDVPADASEATVAATVGACP